MTDKQKNPGAEEITPAEEELLKMEPAQTKAPPQINLQQTPNPDPALNINKK